MPIPVIDSLISSQALLAETGNHYDLGLPQSCTLVNRGMNDHYMLCTLHGRYILRVYSHLWRSLEEILYELELLAHLDRAGVMVSTPIPCRDGNLAWPVDAPEGQRYAVLFSYAVGEHGTHSEERSLLYGTAVGQLHNAGADFASLHQREALDLAYLIDRPLAALAPLLMPHPDDWQSMQSIAALIKENLEQLIEQGLEGGVCHGDCHGGNCHIDEGVITFFDFDFCGQGWPSYDAAVFWWTIAGARLSQSFWTCYLQGYTSVRSLSDLEKQALPLFVAARQIWYMGSQASLAPQLGTARLHDRFFHSNLAFLRDWISKHIVTP